MEETTSAESKFRSPPEICSLPVGWPWRHPALGEAGDRWGWAGPAPGAAPAPTQGACGCPSWNPKGPCTSAIMPCRIVKMQRGVAVPREPVPSLFLGGMNSGSSLICRHMHCGRCCQCTLFHIECALLKPSVRSFPARKIANIFCEMPLMKSSLSPWIGWMFL